MRLHVISASLTRPRVLPRRTAPGAEPPRRSWLSAALALALAAPGSAEALSCMFMPLVHPAAPLGAADLVAHVRVTRGSTGRFMDVGIVRLLYGDEGRPMVRVDVRQALQWRTTPPWTLDRFPAGSEWIMLLRPSEHRAMADYELPLCRAFLRVSGGEAAGHITDSGQVQQMPVEELRLRIRDPAATPQGPARSTRSR